MLESCGYNNEVAWLAIYSACMHYLCGLLQFLHFFSIESFMHHPSNGWVINVLLVDHKWIYHLFLKNKHLNSYMKHTARY